MYIDKLGKFANVQNQAPINLFAQVLTKQTFTLTY